MIIKSAVFVKGVTKDDNMVSDGLPQVAFIGRSNVGKSSIINSLCNNKKLARSSSTAGRTQEINMFLINNSLYFVDLPGYGYARGSFSNKQTITERINWYFFEYAKLQDKVILVVDARAGMTDSDIDMFESLEDYGKSIIIVVNKIDKVNQTEKMEVINSIKKTVGNLPIISFSSLKRKGIPELLDAIQK